MKNSFKYIKKNMVLLTALVLLFITGAGLLVLVENQINSQKIQLVILQKTINKDIAQIDLLVKDNANKTEQIKALLNAPTPTPQVHYIDRTPARPSLSSCTLEGNFYFCPADNCYYNPNGTPTGSCKLPGFGNP